MWRTFPHAFYLRVCWTVIRAMQQREVSFVTLGKAKGSSALLAVTWNPPHCAYIQATRRGKATNDCSSLYDTVLYSYCKSIMTPLYIQSMCSGNPSTECRSTIPKNGSEAKIQRLPRLLVLRATPHWRIWINVDRREISSTELCW